MRDERRLPPTQLDLDAFDMARVGVITLAVLAIVLVLVLNWDNIRWSMFTIGDALIRLGVIGVLSAVAFSTLEVLLDWHTQIRISVLLASLTWMVAGLGWSIHDKRKARRSHGK